MQTHPKRQQLTRFWFGLWILSLGCIPLGGYGQTDCQSALQEAQIAYERGDPFTMPDILDENCLESYTWSELRQYYRLLTLAYLFQEDLAKAEESMRRLLETDPEYPFITEGDSLMQKMGLNRFTENPVEWENLYYRLNPRPYMALRAQLGGNLSFVRSTQLFGLDNIRPDSSFISNDLANRRARIGYQFSLGADFFLRAAKNRSRGLTNIRWELGTEIGYQQNRYQYRHRAPLRTLTQSEEHFARLQFNETQERYTGAVWIKRNLLYNEQAWENNFFYPYVFVGIQYERERIARLSSLSRSTVSDSAGVFVNVPTFNTITDPSLVNVDAQRENWNLSMPVGTGVVVKLRRHYFFADIRWNFGLTNIVNPDARYDNAALVYRYGYVDSNLLRNTSTLNVGYRFAIYKIN